MPWRVTLADADGKSSKHMYSTPRPLRIDEIPEIVEYFRVGAKNALEAGKHLLALFHNCYLDFHLQAHVTKPWIDSANFNAVNTSCSFPHS
jgi:hypothetical protein